MEEIQVVVIGDEKVGKSSMISTLVSQHFSDKVPAILHDVHLPIEDEESSDTMTSILDTSSRSEDFSTVLQQIKTAHAILLIYDITRIETFNRLSSFWLPMIHKTALHAPPITIVGNKLDLRSSNTTTTSMTTIRSKQSSNNKTQITTSGCEELQVLVAPLMARYPSIEACLECSAKSVLNIHQAFFLAQKTVLYPIDPLFDMKTSVRIRSIYDIIEYTDCTMSE